MSNWLLFLKALVAVITAISARSKALADKAVLDEMRKLGRLEALTAALQDAANTIEQANEVRRRFRNSLRDNPDGLRDDDGYRREDIEPSARDPTD